MTATTHRLGDLVRTLRGQVPANTISEPDGPRFFGIAEISARGRGEPRYVDPDVEVRNPVTLDEGDVVVALLSNTGDATMIGADAAGAILGRECVALRITAPNVVLPAWLCAWMDSEECRFQVSLHTTGTAMSRLPVKALENFTVTVPPMAQQVEVDELLRRFDAAIRETAMTLQHLEHLRATELELAIASHQESEG
jgi:hypothetical protein